MKKCFLFALTIFLIFSCMLIGKSQNVRASTNEINYKIKIISDDQKIDFAKIKIDIYSLEKDSTVLNQSIKKLNSDYVVTVSFNENGLYEFNSSHNDYSLHLDLASLPAGYGVLKKIQYLSVESTYSEFIIMKIDTIDIEYNSIDDYNVKLLTKDNVELSAKYEIKHLDESMLQIDVNGLIFEKTIEKKSDTTLHITATSYNNMSESYNTDQTSNEYQTSINYPEKVDVGTYRVRYKTLTDDVEKENAEILAQYVGEYVNNAEYFYTIELGYNKPLFLTEVENGISYDVIYLDLYDGTNTEVAYNGYTDRINNPNTEETDYVTEFKIQYHLNIEYDYYFTENLLFFLQTVIVHEYAHSLMYNEAINNSWVQESFATTLELFYVSEYRNVQNVYVKNALYNRIMTNSFITSPYDLMSTQGNETYGVPYGYGGALFNIFLYEKFNSVEFIYEYINNYNDYKNELGYERIATLNNTTLPKMLEEFGIFRVCPNIYINNFDNYYTKDWLIEDYFKYTIDNNVVSNVSKTPLKMEKYSWHCIKVSKNEMATDNTIMLTFELLNSLSESYCMYIIQQNYDLMPIVDKINSDEDIVSIKTDAINLEYDNDLFIVFMNCSNTAITSPYEFSISYTSRTNNSGLFISDNNSIDINLGNTTFFRPIGLTQAGLYHIELELDNPNSSELRENTIEVYDSAMNLLVKHENLPSQLAHSYEGENSIVVHLIATFDQLDSFARPYYLRIGYYGSNIEGTLKICKIRGTDSIISDQKFSDELVFEDFSGDDFIYYNYEIAGTLEITFTVSDMLADEEQKIFIVKKDKETSSNEFIEMRTLSNENKSVTIEYNTYNWKNIIFILLNGNNQIDIKVNISFTLTSDFTILLDPSNVSEALIGSEVRLNGGLNLGTTITEGFTRNAFLDSSAPSSSRLDYEWTSSNENIATISQYGSILAISPGTTIIQAFHQNGLYGYLIVEVIEETKTNTENFTITTDLRQDSLVGTYVSSGKGIVGGNDLEIGYTRLISLTSDSPCTIIQNYIWSSSNINIATVSSFGTITGISSGTVTITGIYRYNNRYISSITITVI